MRAPVMSAVILVPPGPSGLDCSGLDKVGAPYSPAGDVGYAPSQMERNSTNAQEAKRVIESSPFSNSPSKSFVEESPMRSPSSVVTLLVGFVLALSTLVSAQSATTSLRGTVYDSKGAVVSGAAVTITDNQTGFSRTAKTDSQGEYQFVQLPPATYVVTVAATGFANLKEENVRLMVSTPATLNFTVAVHGPTAKNQDSLPAALVYTTDATPGHALRTQEP